MTSDANKSFNLPSIKPKKTDVQSSDNLAIGEDIIDTGPKAMKRF